MSDREFAQFAFPHCDPKVLHAPGCCAWCDRGPDLQAVRTTGGISFTGQYDPNKQPCPSEEARSLEKIYRWPGNRPLGPRTQYWPSTGEDSADIEVPSIPFGVSHSDLTSGETASGSGADSCEGGDGD